MDRHLSFAQREGRSSRKHTLNFRDYCERNFFRRFGAEIETSRCKKSGINRNADIQKLTPWLLAEGTEMPAKSSSEQVQVRAKKTATGWLLLIVNTERTAAEAMITIEGLPDGELNSPLGKDAVKSKDGKLTLKLAGCEAKALRIEG